MCGDEVTQLGPVKCNIRKKAVDCEDGEAGRVQLLESCEYQVTESLFYTLGGRQSEHKIYYLNWNNLEMKDGTINICARTTVITWYRPGQTMVTLVTGKLQREALIGRRLRYREMALGWEGCG